MTVSVHRGLTELGPGPWDELIGPRGFYAASPWLRHAEATAGQAPYYFTASDARGRRTGVLPAYPLDADTPYVFCSPGRVLDALHRGATGEGADWIAGLLPALACGGRNPAHTKAGTDPSLDREARRATLGAMAAAAEREAGDAGLESVSFLYVDEEDELLRGVLAERGYVALPGQTAYSLPVPEDGSFDSYLARFEQPRRMKIKREIRALAEAGITYRTQPLTADLVERLAPLELALYAKYGTPADAGAFSGVLHSIARRVGTAARVTTAHLDGHLTGFVLTFTHRGEMYARQTGFDYGAQGKLPLYFGLVYYELLRIALAEGLGQIHYSVGSDRAKLLRGCTPRRQIAYVKPRRAELTARLTALAQRLEPAAPAAADTMTAGTAADAAVAGPVGGAGAA
ncbi:GNAT family N-acetyltransferase [Streptomyces sp. NPDC001568]|uniref:GNAT family N-acetyltransferase n=1 Tax=Streptomyces sp. NPDC001568 TaxID=3364588 RepID=UPI0036AB9AA9